MKKALDKPSTQKEVAKPTKVENAVVSGIQQMSERAADELVLEKPIVKRVTYGMRNLGNTCFFNSVM